MMYSAYQAQTDCLAPLQTAARAASSWLNQPHFQSPWSEMLTKPLAASLDVFARLRLTHHRPAFNISKVMVGAPGHEEVVAVSEEVLLQRPFGSLLHFRRADLGTNGTDLPRVLVVAPLSGHFATLLADTVRTLLADHDVFITDWHNARHVPLSEGPFGLDDYVEQLIEFVATLGPGAHVLAVCQPCVPALAAVALMAQREHIAQPRSLTLMAGPVDCRINPTEVNRLAISRPIEWFEKNLIDRVPLRYPGGMRKVYPGFVQLTAFMSMNPDRHRQAFVDLYKNLLAGDLPRASHTQAFYEEYFAVNDLPAEFYLETVQRVFQTYDLAKGEMVVKGQKVEPSAIRRTALFTVEGERDDICAIGQTVAAHDLCTGIKPYMKQHHVQIGVGHYGVFSGKRWQQQIYPRVREMIHSMN